MGQARRRGSFEQRKSAALARKPPAPPPEPTKQQPPKQHLSLKHLAAVYGILAALECKPHERRRP